MRSVYLGWTRICDGQHSARTMVSLLPTSMRAALFTRRPCKGLVRRGHRLSFTLVTLMRPWLGPRRLHALVLKAGRIPGSRKRYKIPPYLTVMERVNTPVFQPFAILSCILWLSWKNYYSSKTTLQHTCALGSKLYLASKHNTFPFASKKIQVGVMARVRKHTYMQNLHESLILSLSF